MKYLLPAALLIAATTLSCNKSNDDDNNNNNGGTQPVERTWKVGGNSHKVNNYATSGETYSAYDADGNSINFTFTAYPPAAGSYRVIDDMGTLSAGQVKVYTASFGSNADTYKSTGNDGVNATVTVENGKVKIVLPETWAKKAATGDSLKVSATLSPI